MLVLDAGAFVAVERGSRDVVALIKRERLAGRSPVTSGGVVAQVWRGGSGRQVPMARLLAGTDVAPIDDRLGRRAGMLLARSGQSDANDAAMVCLAADGDDILTSDPGDLHALAQAAEIHVKISQFKPCRSPAFDTRYAADPDHPVCRSSQEAESQDITGAAGRSPCPAAPGRGRLI
jgi:hypothetical protein